MGKACGTPTEAPAEAAEDVDGKPKKSGVSSRSPMEEIGLWQVPTVTKKGTMAIEGGVDINGEWLCCAHAWEWLCLRGCVLLAGEKTTENGCVVENQESVSVAWPVV